MVRIFLSVLVLAASIPVACRADFITPDSIARPAPGNVASADGTTIASADDLVTNQYVGHGLRFGPDVCTEFCPVVAITNLEGVNVWAPGVSILLRTNVAQLDYSGAIYVSLTAPTDYLALEVIGLSGPVIAFDRRDRQIGFAFVSDKTGPNGGKLLEIDASGIERFEIRGPLTFDFAPGPVPQWGIAGIATSPVVNPPVPPSSQAPEPSSLLLALLGALGVAGPAVRSRLWLKRATV